MRYRVYVSKNHSALQALRIGNVAAMRVHHEKPMLLGVSGPDRSQSLQEEYTTVHNASVDILCRRTSYESMPVIGTSSSKQATSKALSAWIIGRIARLLQSEKRLQFSCLGRVLAGGA